MSEIQASVIPEYREEEVLADLCRESFADFVREFWHVLVPEPLIWNWHIQYLCDKLQEMAERVIAGKPKKHDLIINISPGTSKTLLTSIMLPVWCWTRKPSMRILTVSYAHTLATDISRKSRDLIKSDLFRKCYPEIQIRDDQDAKGHYVNTAGGERYASGTGGAITGKHFHIIIVDDPLDPNAASSDADLASANRWMEETLPTRKVDKSITPTILIMQRLHEFDPTGQRLAKADKIPVFHICYDKDTEILTPEGWVKFPDLIEGMPVGQVDPDTLQLSFVVPTSYVRKHYQGDMLRTESVRLDMMVTPDHRMLVRSPHGHKKGTEGWGFKRASEFDAITCPEYGWVVPQGIRWEAQDVDSINVGGAEWNGDDFARFMGVWLAEGYAADRRVVVSQDEGPFADDIAALLDRSPFRFRHYHTGAEGKHVQFTAIGQRSASFARYLMALGKSRRKYVPKAIKRMSARQIQLFLDWFARGDGHKLPNGNITYTTVSRKLADDIQELVARTGAVANVRYDKSNDCYRIHERKTVGGVFDNVGRVNSATTRWEPYCGEVFCVNVPHSALLVRRNGKQFISGNCLPAELTDDVRPAECRDYYIDGLMDPVRLGEEALSEAEAQGEYPYAAQFLQTPVPRGGAMFQPDKIDVLRAGAYPDIVREVRFWDKAGTQGGGAYTVGLRMGVDSKGKYWILDVVRGQWDSGRREKIMRDTAVKDGRYLIIWIEQEPGSGGKESAEGSIRGLAGYRVRAYKVGKSDGDKEARADAFSAQVNIGNVGMVEAHWNAEFIKELRFFPRSRYKDQVDAASGAFNCLAVPKVVLGGSSVIEEQLAG